MHNIIHGANPENLYRSFGLTMPTEVIDFSTNTNILAWPDIHINVECLASHYPDPQCSRLKEIISQREDISPSRILFTNGTNEAIFLLSEIFTNETAILEPAYSEYSRAFKNLHGVFSLDEALNFPQIIIVNPNNPTGKFMSLAEIIAAHPETTFIIDEAYRDFLLWKKPERLSAFTNVILLRSLTKIFHLSGARIGYIIADENVITALSERQPSWSVNSFAQELALSFLKRREFIAETRNFYRMQTPAFMNMLRASGCEVMDSDVHFFLVKVNDDEKVIKFLLENGIAVRHTRNFANLDGKYIRVATRRPNENEKFAAVMKTSIV